MTGTTYEPDPDDAADDELAAERAGQSMAPVRPEPGDASEAAPADVDAQGEM
ncbi:MAG: hypothetical protein ACYC2Z_03475 [Candidatus Nanopelagicales bacterium]